MGRLAYLTPFVSGADVQICKRISAPLYFWPMINGALGTLAEIDNWELFGDLTPEAASQLGAAVIDNMGPCFMIGSLIPFMAVTLPANVLPCDGSQYEAAAYPDLYNVLPPQFHGSPGYFFTPDLRNKFLYGSSPDWALGDTGGAANVTLDVDQIPPHSHKYTPPMENIKMESPGVPDIFVAGIGLPDDTGETGGGQPHENLPPFMAVNWGIVAKY